VPQRPRTSPTWGGRFREDVDPAVARFSSSIEFDRALAAYDLRLSAAHARMLKAQGLISAADGGRLGPRRSGGDRVGGLPSTPRSKTST
jgi:argininosuccinate lyase